MKKCIIYILRITDKNDKITKKCIVGIKKAELYKDFYNVYFSIVRKNQKKKIMKFIQSHLNFHQ